MIYPVLLILEESRQKNTSADTDYTRRLKNILVDLSAIERLIGEEFTLLIGGERSVVTIVHSFFNHINKTHHHVVIHECSYIVTEFDLTTKIEYLLIPSKIHKI